MRFPYFKAYFLEATSHWCTFYKILYTGCIFKMCRNFIYEVVEQRRRLKAIKKIVAKKIVAQKIKVGTLFFDIAFLKYFFPVLHEASSSWLQFVDAFQQHPVY
jgi:hypothetical protein